MTTPWNPTPNPDAPNDRVTLGEAVGQALGTASMCWADVAAAGEFDSTQCAEVYDGLMAWLSDWADEHRRQANEATAAKLHAAVEGPRGAGLCDCDSADDDPTSWRTGEPLDHHCDCRAVETAAAMLGGSDKTRHHAKCGCGRAEP